jgi:hypothetical protein
LLLLSQQSSSSSSSLPSPFACSRFQSVSQLTSGGGAGVGVTQSFIWQRGEELTEKDPTAATALLATKVKVARWHLIVGSKVFRRFYPSPIEKT